MTDTTFDIAKPSPDLLVALKTIVKRIDDGSGTASWTAEEHDALCVLIDKAEAEPSPDLLAASEAISREAGQLDPHCQPPVMISYAAVIALNEALMKAKPPA